MIKYILFDNNGVLTTSNEETTDRVCARFVGVSTDKMHLALLKFTKNLDKGKMTEEEYSAKVLNYLGIKDVTPSEFSFVRNNAYFPKRDVMEFAKQLSKKHSVALLSNFGAQFDYMNKRVWKLDCIFDRDKMFVSSKIGLIKPNKNIFLYVLKKLNVKPKEVVFIDDNKNNIRVAKSLGINALHFTNLDKLRKDLLRYNLK